MGQWVMGHKCDGSDGHGSPMLTHGPLWLGTNAEQFKQFDS